MTIKDLSKHSKSNTKDIQTDLRDITELVRVTAAK